MDLLSRQDATICAPITATGRAGIGVIRVSGSKAFEFTKQICPFLPDEPDSHRVYYGLATSRNAQRIDEVLVTYFAEGRSFSGEQTTEISCHGSPVLVSQILEELTGAGAKPAARGEFTFRAVMNRRIDLVQAEAVLSLIESETAQSARLALRQLQGELSWELKTIEDHFTWVLANIEAGIDFSTEDIDVLEYEKIADRVTSATEHIQRLVDSFRKTGPIRNGLKIALAGQPNSGKSSLLNALLRQERAIVTDIPGTTRDTIEGELHLTSGKVILVDTAGLRDTTDMVESLGIKAAQAAIDSADYICYLVDLERGIDDRDTVNIARLDPRRRILIGTKKDKVENVAQGFFAISAMTGEGLVQLKSIFEERLGQSYVEDSAVLIRERQYNLLKQAGERVTEALKLLHEKVSLEFVAFELQEALFAVYELTGKKFDDQILDRVFREFCIGK